MKNDINICEIIVFYFKFINKTGKMIENDEKRGIILKKVNVREYLQIINDVVTESESVGEKTNDSFEAVRNAIDNNTLSDLTSEELTKVKAAFAEGTEEYRVVANRLTHSKAPIQVMGIHRKLEKAYEEYVNACQLMVDSIDAEGASVDIDMFNESELKQDESTDVISFCIQRITQLVMKG